MRSEKPGIRPELGNRWTYAGGQRIFRAITRTFSSRSYAGLKRPRDDEKRVEDPVDWIRILPPLGVI